MAEWTRTRCALPQAREVNQRIVGGDVDRQHRGRLLDAQAGGLPKDEPVVDHRPVGDAPPVDEGHLVADPATAHARPDAANHARRLHADLAPERGALVGERRQEAQGNHDVAEVERRRPHLDLDVPGPRRGELAGLHREARDLARVVHGQPVRRALAPREAPIALAHAHQPRGPQSPVAHRQLPFPQVAPGDAGQRIEVVEVAQVDEPEVDPRLLADLERHAAGRSPQHASARLLHVERGPSRHHRQPTPVARVLDPVGDEGPDEGDEPPRHLLARRIPGIVAAEVVHRAQVRRPRPLVERMERTGFELLLGNPVHRLPPLQRGHPARRPASRLAQHPPRAREPRVVGQASMARRRLEQGRGPPRANRRPPVRRIDRALLVVTHQHDAAGHRQPARQLPLFGLERPRIRVREDDLGRAGAQQPGLQFRASGGIDAREPQGGIAQTEGLVGSPGGLLTVPHEPVLGLLPGPREVVDARLQDRAGRLAAAGELHDVARAGLRAGAGPLDRRNQRGRPDLPVGQPIGQGSAGRNELRLPGNPMPASRQVLPARIGREVDVLADMGDQVSRLAVVEADAPPGPLPLTHGVLPPLVRVHPVVTRLRDVTGDPRAGGRAKKRHSLRALRYGEEVRRGQQVVEEYLQAPVQQRG